MKRLSFLLLLVVFMGSCKEEVKTYTLDELHGYWEVKEAKRNGKVTNTLSGAWIKISGNEMMDNFFSSETKYAISLDKNIFTHHTDPPRKFEILSLSAKTMLISTKHNEYLFEFSLRKLKD